MPIRTVKQLCKPSGMVWNDSLAAQIAGLPDLAAGKLDPDAFFARNVFTEGMQRLVMNGFRRLAGRSDVGAYYLSQAMGGGKTHSLLCFGILAMHPSVRHRVLPKEFVDQIGQLGEVKTIVFNGHDDPERFIWGHIADSLGKGNEFAKFWQHGAKAPGREDWVKLLAGHPTVIMIDELAHYLMAARGQAVVNSDLAQLTVVALERLFNALESLPQCCVLLTNLKDDVYRDASAAVRAIIDDAVRQANKYGEDLIPVRQNSSEIYQIACAQLFDGTPDPDAVEDLAQAYVDQMKKAKALDAIAATPESMLKAVRESYPFHPGIRDIVGRFKENAGYQQTRALLRILRHAVRAVWNDDESNTFLIGFQHLDLNVPGALEEVKKINGNYTNAVTEDIQAKGSALAERIDSQKGNRLASGVAKVLLMSSLSTAKDPVRGLREPEIIEHMLDPLVGVADVKDATEALRSNAHYLFRTPGEDRLYFGDVANVTAQIQEIANGLAEEVVDEELRKKLREVFKPVSSKVYHDILFALPSLDDLKTVEDHVSLIILEQPANKLPEAFTNWWMDNERQNRVLVLTADSNAISTLRQLARSFHAANAVQISVRKVHGEASTQYREVVDYLTTTAGQFTSALREAFKTIVFPARGQLRTIADFQMEFTNNDYQGEAQIIAALSKRSKYYDEKKFDNEFDTLRQDAEEILFDAKEVPDAELKRKAAAKSEWHWLPPGGLETLVRTAVERKFWQRKGNIVCKEPPEESTGVLVAVEDREGARYLLSVTPVNGDTIHVSEIGEPEPGKSGTVSGGRWETVGPRVWFLVSDSRGKHRTGKAVLWEPEIEIRPSLESVVGGIQLTIQVMPQVALARVSFDGSSPKNGAVYQGPVMVPADALSILIIGQEGTRWSAEVSLPIPKGGSRGGGPREPREDAPVLLRTRRKATSTREAYELLEALKTCNAVGVAGGTIHFLDPSSGRWCKFSYGDDMEVTVGQFEDMADRIKAITGITDLTLQYVAVRFGTGREFLNYVRQAHLDYADLDWSQV